MKKIAILAVLVAVSGGLAGCPEKPNWLDTTMEWFTNDSEYLGGNTILTPNQLIGIPENAAFANVVSAFRLNDGKNTLSQVVVKAWYVNPDDSFEFVLDQRVTAEPFEVPILVRNANGEPIYNVLHVTVDATYTVQGIYHDEQVAAKQVSCKLVPAETLTPAERKEYEGQALINEILKAMVLEDGASSATSDIGGQ